MDQVSGIKTKAITGALWKFLERMSAQLVSMVVAVLLARLLEPEDYSVVSIVNVFFVFANVFISGGFNAALIQKKDADEEDYASVLFLSGAVAALMYLLLFTAAPWIARVYHKPVLTRVLRVMGLILPVNAVKSVICAYISAHLQFRKFFIATLGGTLASAVVGVAMALMGFGPWALVAQQMTNTIIDTLVLTVTTRMPLGRRISGARIKNLFSYGWRIFASSTVAAVYTQINPLFIGLKYSGTDLAFYAKGKSFPDLLSTVCNSTLSAVLFPVLSKFQDNKEELLRCTRRFIRTGSFVMFPAMLGFFAVSDTFVQLLLTDKWMPVARYIRIFCVGELFATVHSGNCEAIKAMGRSDVFLKMEILKKSGYFAIIGVAIFLTDTPVALAYSAIACTVWAIIINCVPNIRLLGYRIKYQLQDVLPNLICAVVMCAAVGQINMEGVPLLAELTVQILTGAVVYLAMCLLIRNESLFYILRNMKSMGAGAACRNGRRRDEK